MEYKIPVTLQDTSEERKRSTQVLPDSNNAFCVFVEQFNCINKKGRKSELLQGGEKKIMCSIKSLLLIERDYGKGDVSEIGIPYHIPH